MKATKRYSRSTSRKAIDTEEDPYLLDMEPIDMGICSSCNAIYHDKRWRLATDEDLAKRESFVEVTCPACKKIQDNFVGGYVTLKGEFLAEHKEEVLNMVRNKEERARHNNPLERIIDITESQGTIEITTTTEKLAQRLGQMLGKSFGGDVEYKWSDDVKLARVVWKR